MKNADSQFGRRRTGHDLISSVTHKRLGVKNAGCIA
jgi:hypothetical protein